MEQNWSDPCNPADPIEILFNVLEVCCVLSICVKPSYTAEQMIDKAVAAIKHTVLYSTDMV